MKKVLILGATGTIGRPLTQALLKKPECKLTVFSRHSRAEWGMNQKMIAIDGDATSKADLAAAVAGQDVVVCTFLGSSLPQVAQNLISIMKTSTRSHLIFMSSVGIYNEIPEEMDEMDNVNNNPAQVPHRESADMLEASDLNYTIIRSGYWQSGSQTDFVLARKTEPAKGYITTIPSLVYITTKVIMNDNDYRKENIAITRKWE